MHSEKISTATMTVTVSLKLLMPVKINAQSVDLLGTVKRTESVFFLGRMNYFNLKILKCLIKSIVY